MAVLHVDKGKAGLMRPFGGDDEVVDQLVELAVAQHLGRADAEATVELAVGVGALGQRIAMRSRPSARMGQLQPHHQVVGRPVRLGVGVDQPGS